MRAALGEVEPRQGRQQISERQGRASLFIGLFTAMLMAMSTGGLPKPRLLRAVSPPLASYFRVGRDHKSLQALLAEERASFAGLVFEAWDHDRQGELRAAAAGHAETILDTKAFELSTVRGPLDERLAHLAWAGDDLPHTSQQLGGAFGQRLASRVADEVAEREYSAVLAPTHLLRRVDDEWLSVDLVLARLLRTELDLRKLQHVTIYFPLTLHTKVFHSAAARAQIIGGLASAPIDAIWLRIHPFAAATAGPMALRRYIEGARDLQRLGLPIVGEHTGTAGVAMLAFGAIGGIESGITFGERFDANSLFREPKPSDKPFAPSPRVYLHTLGTFVSRDQARTLMEKPGMRSLFGCRDTSCCARGPADTQRDPRRHFLLQRQREVTEISRRPEPVRPSLYLEEFLRPATDLALRAVKVDRALERSRKRLDDWRLTLGAMNQDGPPASVALSPEGKRTQPHLQRTAS